MSYHKSYRGSCISRRSRTFPSRWWITAPVDGNGRRSPRLQPVSLAAPRWDHRKNMTGALRWPIDYVQKCGIRRWASSFGRRSRPPDTGSRCDRTPYGTARSWSLRSACKIDKQNQHIPVKINNTKSHKSFAETIRCRILRQRQNASPVTFTLFVYMPINIIVYAWMCMDVHGCAWMCMNIYFFVYFCILFYFCVLNFLFFLNDVVASI